MGREFSELDLQLVMHDLYDTEDERVDYVIAGVAIRAEDAEAFAADVERLAVEKYDGATFADLLDADYDEESMIAAYKLRSVKRNASLLAEAEEVLAAGMPEERKRRPSPSIEGPSRAGGAYIARRVRGRFAMKGFAQLLGGFLLEYVPRRRNLSENTAKSYRDSFVLLLGWLAGERGITPDDVRIEDLGRDSVEAFCLWLADARGSCAATVNVRLTALRSFASYVSFTEPAYLDWASGVRAVEFSKSPSREVEHLPVEAVSLIMESASSDVREHAMLGLLYDSGARVSEISGARRCDLRLEAPATIRLKGKGKVRIVPLCDQVAGIASAYLAATSGAPDSPLFVNRSGKAIGRAGITYVLKKHVAAAHEADPLVVPPTTHPHALRHSKAVHLVEADVNIIYIRDFMGHSSVKTTEIYAKISSKSRREAVEKAAANLITESAYGEEEKSAIMEWLKNLL